MLVDAIENKKHMAAFKFYNCVNMSFGCV